MLFGPITFPDRPSCDRPDFDIDDIHADVDRCGLVLVSQPLTDDGQPIILQQN